VAVAALRWSVRLVAAQCAALALLLAAVHNGPLGWFAGGATAAVLALLGLGRWRGRWLSAWSGDALRYLSRPRTLPLPAGPAALLGFARPTATLGEAPATVEDAWGVVTVLDLGDTAGLLADAGPRLPAPTRLVPAAGPLPPGVQVTVQLLACVAQPAGSGPASTSYRQLTDGVVPVRQRALLVVRLSRVDGGWPGAELRGALSGAVRRLSRQLTGDGFDCRPLGPDGLRVALDDLVPGGSAGGTVREVWSGLVLGGRQQTCLRATGVHRLPAGELGSLVPRLLATPAGMVAVSVSAAGGAADLVIRLAGTSPAGLAAAVAAARQQATAAGLSLHRLDGDQRGGLAATLPLGVPPAIGAGPGPAGATALPAVAEGSTGPPASAEGPTELAVLPPAGLMLGRNRQDRPLTAGLFGPDPIRAVLLGGVRATQVLALRALALGAQVSVQTARPYAWEPFLRAISLPADAVALLPPGRLALPVPGPSRPQLVIVDVGPVGPAQPVPAAGWRASLVLRDELTVDDVDLLVRADLVVLQPLSPDEAALAGAALGLADGRDWLTRIPAGMVGAVARPGTGRATLRWALLSPTDLERQLIGSTERVAIDERSVRRSRAWA
jgi:type VII secretion protein EccE